MRVWSAVAEMLAAHGACALVTVAAVRGSAPREAGARMVVGPDGGFRGPSAEASSSGAPSGPPATRSRAGTPRPRP